MIATRFPVLERLDDVMDVVNARPEFNVMRRDGFVTVDYAYRQQGTFGDLLTEADPERVRDILIAREIRGLKFCAGTGRLLARPYHKFFNLGEIPEVQPQRIDWSAPHAVLYKLDGSMIHTAPLGGKAVCMTRGGVSEQAVAAQALFDADPRYARFAWAMMDEGWTPIFEYCSPLHRIVILYDRPQLTLTAIRHMRTGAYMARAQVVELARAHDVPVVGAYESNLADVDAFVAEVKDLADIEGFVVHFEDGLMVKFKTEPYVAMHHAIDDLASEKKVIRLLVEQAEDDMIPKLQEKDAAALVSFRDAFHARIGGVAETVDVLTREGLDRVGGDRKRFVLEVADRLDPRMRSIALAVMTGKDAREVILGMIGKNANSSSRIDEIRPLFGGLKWQDYYAGFLAG